MGLLTLLYTLIPLLLSSEDDSSAAAAPLLLLLSGFIFYFVMYSRYRNADKRHSHESETQAETVNLQKGDTLLEHRTRLTNAKMKDANHARVEGALNVQGKSASLMESAGKIIGL